MRKLTALCLALTLVLAGGTAALAAWVVDGNGQASVQTGELGTGATPTATVTARTATTPSGAIAVGWAGTDHATSYAVQRMASGSLAAATVGSACNVLVEGLACTEAQVPEGTWRYRVTPWLGAWAGTPSELSSPVVVAAAQPSGLTASAAGAGRIDVSWTNNSQLSGITYRLETSPTGTGSSWIPLADGLTTPGYAHTGLPCATTRHYRVRVDASDPTLHSPYTPAPGATATTAACPATTVTTALANVSTDAQGANWLPQVRITVTDDLGGAVSGVTITGNFVWSNGASNGRTCTTGTDGTCIAESVSNSTRDEATFTITGVSGLPAGVTWTGATSTIAFPRP